MLCRHAILHIALITAAAGPLTAQAGARPPGTGGVSQVEGAGGGGLVPWALIAGSGTREQVGATGFATWLDTGNFRLNAAGAALAWQDRVELSFARQRFDLGDTVPGQTIALDTLGLKWRIYGDAIADQDSPWPQLAIGAMYKRNRDFDRVPAALGARHASALEPYVAASKVWIDGLAGYTTVLNGTVRASRANQFGILGFGGDRNDRLRLYGEASAALFLTDRLVAGLEWRQKPDNLKASREQAAFDGFVAWLPRQHVAVTLAYVQLGNIADKAKQGGPYVSIMLDW
ncbi:DUF3034 family protein [Chitinimonas sp.]|uniref:DUF3034 family protein n=1 Tax=Chitinimonas sp. TaxID=1934313 RepID=UPI0035AFB6C1